MISQTLQGNWKMKETGADGYCNVTIPGSVYSALLENGLMEDPFYRDNEEEALKLSEKDYEFVVISQLIYKENYYIDNDGRQIIK